MQLHSLTGSSSVEWGSLIAQKQPLTWYKVRAAYVIWFGNNCHFNPNGSVLLVPNMWSFLYLLILWQDTDNFISHLFILFLCSYAFRLHSMHQKGKVPWLWIWARWEKVRYGLTDRALVATGLLTKHMVIVVNVATAEDTMKKNA